MYYLNRKVPKVLRHNIYPRKKIHNKQLWQNVLPISPDSRCEASSSEPLPAEPPCAEIPTTLASTVGMPKE